MCNCLPGGRNCCAPIVPPNDKAETWKIVLYVVIIFHFAVFVVKTFLMGIFAGVTDLGAITILVVALFRFDYCQVMIYIVLNLAEVFALIVVLGYYLQTDMGKNVPQKKKLDEDPPQTDEGKKDDGGEGKNAAHGGHNAMPAHKQKENITMVLLRSLFDSFLQLKYDFYKAPPHEYSEQGVKVAGAATQQSNQQEETAVQLQDGDEDKSQKLSKRFGPTFIITFCSVLILFYIIVSVLAHFAYREWKGIAEDQAKGSVDFVDGNWLHYAVIAKREDDRLEELKEERELRKNKGLPPLEEDDESEHLLDEDQV